MENDSFLKKSWKTWGKPGIFFTIFVKLRERQGSSMTSPFLSATLLTYQNALHCILIVVETSASACHGHCFNPSHFIVQFCREYILYKFVLILNVSILSSYVICPICISNLDLFNTFVTSSMFTKFFLN